MKLKISILLAATILLFSCQRDQEETQTIDQVLKLYIKNSTNPDLLNPKIKGSYTSASLLDLLGAKDSIAITGYSLLKDSDTITYLDYPAGAIRLKIDSLSNDDEQIYYSLFALKLAKSATSSDKDLIKIEYRSTPSVFQISKLWYNGELKFTKVPGQPNIVEIVK